MVSDPGGFERNFWRATPAVGGQLPALSVGSVDDATFRLLADAAPTLCWIANGDGYIVWYNRRWHDYCGTAPDEMEGWGWTAVHDPASLPDVMERWTASIASGEPFEMTFPLRGADGVFRPFLTRIQPVRDASGRVARWFGVNTEITAQAGAEEALRVERDRSRAVLDGMAEGFALLDRDFRIVDVNAEAMRLETRPRDAIIGRTHWEAYPGSEESDLGRLYKRAMTERRPVGLEHRYVWADGRATWLEMRAFPVADGLAVFYRDVTDRKEVELALREREQRLSLVVEGAADYAILTTDPERRVTSWSAGAAATFGYEADEIIGRSADMLFTPEDRAAERPEREFETAMRDGIAPDVRWHQRRDGGRVFVNGVVRPLRDAEGRELGFLKIARDETGRHATEEALRETSERYRLAVQATSDAIWDWNLVTNHVGWNEAVGALFGHTPDRIEPTGEWWISHIHPDDRERVDRSIHAVIDGAGVRWSEEYRFLRADGGYADVLDRGAVLRDEAGRAVRMIGAMLDLTERKAAEAALRESEARLRAIIGTAPVGIVMSDATGAIYDGNSRTEEIFGHPILHSPDAESYGEWVSFHPDGRRVESREYPLARALAGEERPELVSHYRRGDGRLVWVRIVGSAVRDEAGAVTGGIVAVLEIDAEKRAQAELRSLNATLERQVEERTAERDRVWRLVPDLLMAGTLDGRLLAVNPAWTRVLGFDEETLLSRPFWELIDPDFASASAEAVAEMREGRTARHQNRVRTAEGGYRWFDWVSTPVGDQFYAVARDITDGKEREAELERAQEALRQSQKMETVGQLTGGVAHDFNNLLQIVTGNLETLQRNLPADMPRMRRAAENAQTGAKRAATLTQRLLAFSRRQPLAPKPISVNRLVGDMSELLHRTLGETIELETVLASGLWRAEADPNQLENALLNLAVNARDAMPEGGKLTVETANAHLDRGYTAQNAEVQPGQYVVICVSDTGAGMDAATADRVFEPFFTTKEVGKGTGLGLSMVYGFVKQSGGHVKIYSEVDHGTTVKIYLPRLLGASVEEAEVAEAIVPEGTRDETILVCEDDDDVRAYSVESLRELGYRVIEAHDGPSALRLLERQEGRVDLLFSDVVLPGGMTGADLAVEARRLRPGLKVLFTTGYARDAIVHHGRLDAGVELVTKPFTYADLAARVRDVLDAEGGA